MPRPARTRASYITRLVRRCVITRLVRRCVISCLAVAALCFGLPAFADYLVGAGGRTSLSTGKLDLACSDLIVFATLNVDAAAIINVRDVIIQPGGIVHAGTGSVTLSRNFTVAPGGQFFLEQGTVNYNTNCGPGLETAKDIPALGNESLIALAALLSCLALIVLGRKRTLLRNTVEGVEK